MFRYKSVSTYKVVVLTWELLTCWYEQFGRVCYGARSVTVAGVFWSNWPIMCQRPPTFSVAYETCHTSSMPV